MTLALDPVSQDRLNSLRCRHFPPERNVLQAHVTLFHALPGERVAQLLDDVRRLARREPHAVEVTGVRSLGRGTALTLLSPALEGVRAGLAVAWSAWLTPQDRQRFSPHVTVQNKVTPERARALLAQLRAEFTPWTVQARGIALWSYAGGPWEPIQTVPFRVPAL